MTVEAIMDDPRDQFPVGMRVLAVDDDPTCLLVLETLLRRCQYHVTTTSQAITALKLLRENKNKFDLVISDVHMPDMDGFKLLELVGLEMDLPVIMLSAYGDTKLVMKGITHGACDYLLKPVRIEELKNIWQHVIRRKKFDSKEQSNPSNQDKPHSGSGNGLASAGTSNIDQKMTKKRKDQDDEEDEDHEEDPSTQKKPRVVWTVELHRKFVAAVNQLGIDKAVPKKILDLMNVEKLTRENVASHLQKYRLYLKRISCVANQQANLVAALGTADQSYLRMGSLSGLRHLRTLSGSGQFQNNVLRSFPPSGVIGRLNTPAGLGVHGLPSSRNFQFDPAQNLNNSMNDPLKFQSAIVHDNQNGSAVQGMLGSTAPDLQHHKHNGFSSAQDLTNAIDDKTMLPILSEPPDPTQGVTSSCSRTLLSSLKNNSLMAVARSRDTQGGRAYENLSSVETQPSEFSLSVLDHGRCSDNWSDAVQSSEIQPSSYPPSGCSRQIAVSPTDRLISTPSDVGSPNGASSITLHSSQSHDLMADIHLQGDILANTSGHIRSNVPLQGWDDRNQDATTYHSNVVCSSMKTLIPVNGGVSGPASHTPTESTFYRNLDFNFGDPIQTKHDRVTKLAEEISLKQNRGHVMDQLKAQQSAMSNNFGSLEDLVSAMMKQDHDKVQLLDGDFICNNYPAGTSM